jgi:hypothetical protein
MTVQYIEREMIGERKSGGIRAIIDRFIGPKGFDIRKIINVNHQSQKGR